MCVHRSLEFILLSPLLSSFRLCDWIVLRIWKFLVVAFYCREKKPLLETPFYIAANYFVFTLPAFVRSGCIGDAICAPLNCCRSDTYLKYYQKNMIFPNWLNTVSICITRWCAYLKSHTWPVAASYTAPVSDVALIVDPILPAATLFIVAMLFAVVRLSRCTRLWCLRMAKIEFIRWA